MTKTARNGILTPRQDLAALSLARGASAEMAATESGAKLRTIWSWRLLPEFKARVSELRMEMTAQALGKLTDNLSSAADSLAYLSRRAKSEMVRVIAAAKIFEVALKVKDATEIEERIRALEERQQAPARPRSA
jgi:hypothetical protein